MSESVKANKILVIDDNQDAADITAELLQILGFETMVAYDGVSALGIAQQYQPAVIFCDIGMPEMDGYEVIATLRAMPSLNDTRIVALTAWSDQKTRIKVIAAGFHSHLLKPASLEALLHHAS